jgi:hypothetical protein
MIGDGDVSEHLAACQDLTLSHNPAWRWDFLLRKTSRPYRQ